jgi:hypothetical protein
VQKVSITVVNKKYVKKYYPQKFEQVTKRGRKLFRGDFLFILKEEEKILSTS